MTAFSAALLVLALLNVSAFGAFAVDKWLARKGKRRLPEAFLLQLALLGGSPAAKFAQHRLRHKTRKQPFGARLNGIVALHVLLLGTMCVLTVWPAARMALGIGQ